MSTPVFQTIDLRFTTCLNAVIMDNKLAFPSLNGVPAKILLALSPQDPYTYLLYFPPDTVPAYHGMILDAGLMMKYSVTSTPFLRDLLSDHTIAE